MNPGRERLERRQRIRKVIHDTIEAWNERAELLHMGHRIDLGGLIADALMADADNSVKGETNG
jgi:hypothetical protein